ncbi:desmoglein-2-like [Carassius gibelio]|uniref:desmoglein-2-like n=1 Tax=Carassius gibelio TaxID=101364 RepID=UPI002277B52C|nr:desmoglein-2-like [Carassius gibelio]
MTIRSDNDETMKLHYTLRGPGADQPPVGYFVVDTYTGLVHIIRPLDREERQYYTLIGTAWYSNKTIAEDNIKINVVVEDQNDNSPVFIKPERSSIYEGRPVGTFITQVVAKDADELDTPHTKIVYSLIKQEPNDGTLFFAVDKDNGTIYVKSSTLDREEHSSFVLTLQAADMYGSPEGNSATATVFIDILDVNDNIPTLEKDEFSASIEENEAPVEVLRIQALDNDEERTDNWLAEFEIVSGNEDGRFSIETDPKTNIGVLYLNKPVDFESVSYMNLNLVVANKALPGAPGAAGASGAGGQHVFFGGSSSVPEQKKYLVKISVKNKPESPKFRPKIKPISVSENPLNIFPRVIDTYTSTEEDTGKTAEKVKYAKGYDPDNWISIDMDTAEIKLNKVPDRESPFVINGTYYAKILCITDELHSQTSTGTIALQVEDLNDNCPKLLDNVQIVCSDASMVSVTAEDGDSDPNGAPLEFRLIQEKTKGKWNLQQINDVSASLLAEDDLWPGFYEVTMEIRDKQGLVCPDEQVLRLEVCTCSEGMFCGSKVAAIHTTSASFGAAGISFLILGFLCLILVPMAIIKCEFGNHFTEMPIETKQYLISYCTEGKATEIDIPQMKIPPKLYNEGLNKIQLFQEPLRMVEANSNIPADEIQVPLSNHAVNNNYNIMQMSAFGGFYNDMNMVNSARWQEEQISLDAFLKKYLEHKSHAMEDGYAKNESKAYDYEGKGSPVGSVGCCSILEDNNDLEFLNDLGPKFTTLAEICGGKKSEVPAPLPLPLPPKPTGGRTEVVSSSTNVINPVNITINRALFLNALNVASNTATTSSTRVENVMVTDSRPTVFTSVQPAQTLLVQPQPMYYMVEPQPSTALLAERPAVGQNMYVLNSGPVAEGVVVQGANIATNTLTRGERMVLVDGGAPAQAGMLHTGNMSGSQMFLVDGGATSGQVLQGTLRRGVAGSQGLLVMEGQGGQVIQGSLKKGVSTQGGSQNVLYMDSEGGSGGGVQRGMMSTGSVSSIGLGGSSVQINQNPSSHKVVVQERKVVTTQSVK